LHGSRAVLGCMMLAALAAYVAPVRGQLVSVSTSEKLLVTATSSVAWSQDTTSIIQLQGAVQIEMDDLTLTADNAVIWLSPEPGGLLGEQQADIVLMGNAVLHSHENNVTRSGDSLIVSAGVKGTIRISSDQPLVSMDASDGAIFRQAQAIRSSPPQPPAAAAPAAALGTFATTEPSTEESAGTVSPGTGIINSHGDVIQQIVGSDNTITTVLTGKVYITQLRPNGDFMELLADKAVIFTNLDASSMKNPDEMQDTTRHVTGAYLEGDVRINFTAVSPRHPEQRLTADRAFYDFTKDRAVLTGVVLHTIDPRTQIPIVIRAQTMRQLSMGEYDLKNAELTTSTFAVPTFSVRASDAYLVQVPRPTGDVDNNFVAKDMVPNFFGVPVFYFPAAAGTINDDPIPLRNFTTQSSQRYGFAVTSDWGLFESLGRPKPQDVDVSYHLDDYSKRGFGTGIDTNYEGGFIDDNTRQPWSYEGDFTSYIINDRGIDQLGGDRTNVVPPQDIRGKALWEHQQFFPDDWQVQIRAGYVSDPTFLEEYYQDQFDDGLPYNASFYAKRQQDTEAITFLGETDTTPFITDADRQQEQTDIQRAPEIGYQRIGDSVLNDDMTFYSDNSASRLAFQQSRASLAEQGFGPGLSPGLPSDGLTGIDTSPVLRGDSRQELDWPFALAQFKLVPYVLERVTTYSDSPGGDPQTRLYSGAGVRLTTAFWKVDDSVESDMLDIHRMRNVVQPEINLFGSGTTLDRSKLFDYDPNIDAINDIEGGQLALHERWQTMRGGPGEWRSVDLLEWNIEGNYFRNQPPPDFLQPTQFRGLFFSSAPETSVPRSGVNTDITWHVSDTTAILSDAEYNADHGQLATASAGIAVSRDDRLSYYVDDRYLGIDNSQVVGFSMDYELSKKYTLQFGQSFNFGDSRDVDTQVTVVRHFDAFSLAFTAFHDAINNNSGFNFNLIPVGSKGPSAGLSGLTGPIQ
jgi:lipopolysaccharide export system protein LptA